MGAQSRIETMLALGGIVRNSGSKFRNVGTDRVCARFNSMCTSPQRTTVHALLYFKGSTRKPQNFGSGILKQSMIECINYSTVIFLA